MTNERDAELAKFFQDCIDTKTNSDTETRHADIDGLVESALRAVVTNHPDGRAMAQAAVMVLDTEVAG